MSFLHAFARMLAGKKVARYSWQGLWEYSGDGDTLVMRTNEDRWKRYWEYNREADTIMMHEKDGVVINIRDTNDFIYTMLNMLANDWKEIEDEE